MAHEDAYLAHLEAKGVSVRNLRNLDDPERAVAETRDAMESGVEAIAQATLAKGRWFGRSDVLRRVERGSKLGGWSYEVYDCKLACETKAATILQLSLYSELLAEHSGNSAGIDVCGSARSGFSAGEIQGARFCRVLSFR